MPWDEETQEFTYAERPNKTLIKLELKKLQEVIKRVIDLPKSQFPLIPMTEMIRVDFELAKRIERGALQRHIRYMSGKITQDEADEMTDMMDRLAMPQRRAVERLHRIEQWRDKLIGGDNALLTELVGKFEDCDAQYLRQLTRNANKEISDKKPPKSSRLIFKYLDGLVEQQEADAPDDNEDLTPE